MIRRLAAFALAASIVAATPAAAETKLVIGTHYNAGQMAPLTACFREYEAMHPGLRIEVQQSDIDDFLQTILTSRIGGSAPDIYNVYSLWAPQLVDAGVLDAPPPAITSFVEAAYLPGTSITIAGRSWGIPAEIATFLLIYNKRLVPEPPRTWDEAVATAARVTKRNAQGKATTMGFVFGPSPANGVYPFYALMLSKGAAPFSPDMRHANLTSPQAIAALSDMTRLFTDAGTDISRQVRDFPSGDVGMMIYANWYKDVLRDAFGPNFTETVGVAPIPAGPDWRTVQYGFFWGVDAASSHKADAWELLRWLNTPRSEGQRSCTGDMLIRLGALTGNRADIAASRAELGDAFTRPFVEAIESGRAVGIPLAVHMAEVQTILRTALGRAWTSARSPADALRGAEREIAPLLADR